MTTDPRFDRRTRRTEAAAWTATSRRGVVACAHYLAADAGQQALQNGGSAVDAAIAAALALNVCEPAASGLGGMAMALVQATDETAPACFSGPCVAPAAATPERVAEANRNRGHRAVAVPGAPAVWSALHRRFGRLPFRELVGPAIEIARAGFPLTNLQRELVTTYQGPLRRRPIGALFFGPDGTALPAGTLVRQPVLARTLEHLGTAGPMDVYRGEIARMIVADMEQNGGFVAATDLEQVTEPEPTDPITAPLGAARVFTVGPPAGGLALAQLCAMATACDHALDVRDPRDLDLVAEMIRRVRRDRQRYRLKIGGRELGQAKELLEPESVQASLQKVQRRLRTSPGETSHVSAMDSSGMTVAMTVSIERSFGSACMSPELGFLYNGYLRGFKVKNRRHPHFLRPGAPARSNAAPTIARDANGRVTALGSTGSERMTSGIFTTLLRLQFEEPFDAVAGPRIHCTPTGDVLAELERWSPECAAVLTARHAVTDLGAYSFQFGGLHLATRSGDRLTGVAEPRRDGGVGVAE